MLDYRYAEGNDRSIAELAADLVRLNVDVIVLAGGDNLIRDVMSATKTISLVIDGQGSDPVRAGFVMSLARQGGNVTGLSILAPEISGKQLEILNQILPKLSRIAVLGSLTRSDTTQALKEQNCG